MEKHPWPRREAKAVEPLEKPTDLPWREGRNSLPADKKNPEDTATDQKGEPRGDQKSKRRKAPKAAPPRTERRDGEEKENRLDHNQEKTYEQRGDGRAPPKGTEDPTCEDTRIPATRQDQDKAAKWEIPQEDQRTGNHG